jgi:hypothetical protein
MWVCKFGKGFQKMSNRIFKEVFLAMLVFITLALNAAPKPDTMDRKDKYLINNKSVSRKEFETFLATLKEVPGTWFCAETNKGGVTGYDALDSKGVVYRYRSESSPDGARNTLTLK